MIRPKPDIPERVPILSFPTPAGNADLLFYEVRDGTLPKNKTWAYGDPHPDRAQYPHHELVFVASEGSSAWQRWYYAAARENQHLYNWQVADTSEWPQLTQTFVVRRDEFSTSATYPLPPLEFFPYPLEWSTVGVDERPISDEVLASTYVTVVVTREKLRLRKVTGTTNITVTAGSSNVSFANASLRVVGHYVECPAAILPPGAQIEVLAAPSNALVSPAPVVDGTAIPATIVSYVENELTGREFDADTNATNTYRRSKVAAGTAIPTGVQSDGSIVELQPVNTLWSLKTTKQAAGLAGSANNGVATRSYKIITNYAWPAVLNYVRITPVYADPSNVFSQITGYVTTPIFASDPYSGPCLATIVETWTSKMPIVGGDPTWTSNSPSNVSPKLEEPTPLLPKSIAFNSPLLNVEVPMCLHGYVTFYAANFQQEYPATNYTRWPGSVVAEVELRPHQGGWLKRVVIVDAPALVGGAFDSELTLVSTASTSFNIAWTHTQTPAWLRLDVSTDPSFKTGFLPGFKDLNVLSTTSITVTGATRGVPYYCRLRAYRFVGLNQVAWESNTLMVMCPPVPEIALFTAGPDGELDTGDDVSLPAVTGTLDFGATMSSGPGTVRPVLIRNTGLLSLSGLSVAFTGGFSSFFSPVGALPDIPAGASATIDVRFAPTYAGGSMPTGSTMVITSNAANTPSYVVNLAGSAVAPEINVKIGGTGYPTGGTVPMGTVNTGSSGDVSLTVENLGTGLLTLTSLITGTNASEYELIAAPESIAAGNSGVITVRFSPQAGGTRVATLSLANNDADENPYVLTLSGTGNAVGEIEVQSPEGFVLVSSVDTLNFGTVRAGSADFRTLTLTIFNRGAGTLSGLTASLILDPTADFSLGSLAASIPAGGSATLDVTFDPASTGAHSASLRIASSDADENPYVIALVGAGGTGPIIQVERPAGTVLTSGTSSVDFGPTEVTGGTSVRTFTLRNLGSDGSSLSISAIAVNSGVAAADYTITGITLPASLGALASTTFQVTFNPSVLGVRAAVLTISSNASNTSSFVVNLTGNGTPSNALTTWQAASVAVGAASLSDNSVASPSQSKVDPTYCAVSSAGRLAISAVNEHRVLIWNSVPTASGQPADLVIGQTNFTGASPGISATRLNSPGGVAWAGNNLIVADSGNHRVLVFNNPSTNGQAANVVIGQTSLTANTAGTSQSKLRSPTGVHVNSGVLYIADTLNHRIVVLSSVPTSNGAPFTFNIGQGTSWTTLTTGSAANKFNAPADMTVIDSSLVVADMFNNRVTIFTPVPSGMNSSAVRVIGQTGFGVSGSGLSSTQLNLPAGVAASVDGRLAIADHYNNRVLHYYALPTVSGAPADVVLGQANFVSGGLWGGGTGPTAQVMQVPQGLAWNGFDLISCGGVRAMIFKPTI